MSKTEVRPSRGLGLSRSLFFVGVATLLFAMAKSATADQSESTSSAFALYLGPSFAFPGTTGDAEGSSPAFPLFLGPGFVRLEDRGDGFGSSAVIPLYTGRFREGFAVSGNADLDTRPVDPAVVHAPAALSATPSGCTGEITLHWTDLSPDENGFIVERKLSGFAEIFYDVVRTTGPNVGTIYDLPPYGGYWTYRVRAFRGQARSAYTNEASAVSVHPSIVTNPSADVVVKSVGDRHTLRVHVSPPSGSKSWNGISRVTVQMGTSATFTTPIQTIPRTSVPLSGEVTLDFTGTENQDYWFRVFFRNACGQDYQATPAPVGPRKPQRAPVLFVHGFRSGSEIWTDWAQAFTDLGWPSAKVMKFQCPGDTWEFWARELKETLDGKDGLFAGDWSMYEQCDIVAHSQGGLASRSYIEQKEGWRKVRRLFMLGTPNHGGNFARTASWQGKLITHCTNTGHADGAYTLRSDSKALSRLNYDDESKAADEQSCERNDDYDDLPPEVADSRRHTTQYYAVAGTASDVDVCRNLFCTVKETVTDDPCSGDGIVAWQSVRLRSLLSDQGGACTQWLDTDLEADYHVGRLSHDDLTNRLNGRGGSTLLNSSGVRQFVREVLSDEVAHFPATCMRDWSAPSASLRSIGATASDRPVVVSMRDDTTAALETKLHQVSVEGGSNLVALVAWRSGSGTIRLRGPDSTEYVPADTSAHSWLSYEEDDTLGYAAFGVKNPSAGTWALRVQGGSTTTVFTDTWVLEGAENELVVSARPDGSVPTASLVSARLLHGGVPLPASMEARITPPTGPSTTLTLEDGGANGDSLAGDHVYATRYSGSSSDGEYAARVTAREEPATPSSAMREAEVAFSVFRRPWVTLDPAGLASAPPATWVGRLSEIRASIANQGAAAAESLEVRFTQVTGESLGVLHVTVPAHDSTEIAILWTPGEPGTHTIRVELRSNGALLDPRSTLAADLDVPVLATSLVLDAPPPAAALPQVVAFAPPAPNPTRGTVTFRFDLPRPARAALTLYDVQGRRMASVASGYFGAGRYTRTWNGRDASGSLVSAGVYFASLEVEGRRLTKRLVVLR